MIPAIGHRYGMSAEAAKSLGLEAILWVARTQPRRVKLRGIHARAARLPANWWLERFHWSVEKLIIAVEQAAPVSEPDVRGLRNNSSEETIR